jgi:hypothetical protein
MPSTLSLEATNGTLGLTINENGWCRVLLIQAETKTQLGADLYPSISARLRRFIVGKGREHAWVLTLSEQYSVFYGDHKDGVASLRIVSSDGVGLTELFLSEEQQNQWLTCLSS